MEFAYDRASWKIYRIETAYPQYAQKCNENARNRSLRKKKTQLMKTKVAAKVVATRNNEKRIFVKVMSYEMEHSFLRNDLD